MDPTHLGHKSGVPGGSVLGPLLFLIYINDITNNIQSDNRLFADDCIMYRPILISKVCSRTLILYFIGTILASK